MKTKSSWMVAAAIACGVLADSGPVHAQAPSAPPAMAAPSGVQRAPSTTGGEHEPWNRGVPEDVREAAREVFLEGNRLFRMPLFAQAVEKYSEALATWKHPAFYFNLALAQLNLGQDTEAHENFEEAMRYGAAPLGTEEYQDAKKYLAEIERRLGRLRISCPTPGAEVSLDGVPLFTGPGSRDVWVKAQAHEITAKRTSYVTQVKRVTVASGSQQVFDLPLRKMIEERPWAGWKPWAVVGAGVALAGAGGVLHALSARDFRTYDDGFLKLPCAAAGCTKTQIAAENPRLGAALSRARREQRLAIGGYIAGGAAVVAGAVLVYLNRPRLAEQEAPEGGRSGITVVPVVSGDTLGVLVNVGH